MEDSVYVDPAHQGRGVGKGLIEELVRWPTPTASMRSWPASSGATTLDRLAQACGFDMVGVEREVGRKFGRWLDVVVMQRLVDRLAESTPAQSVGAT